MPHRHPLPMTAPLYPSGWQSPIWSLMHRGFASRPDLTDEPIWRCPAMDFDNATVEWCALFGDAEHGAHISREAWSPAWRDINRMLRNERRQIDRSVKASEE
jgi:hypothetical protein